MIDKHGPEDAPERYAAGLLSAAEARAFEDHLVVCARCQTEVRLAVGVRRVARAATGRSRRQRMRLIAGASLGLAAGLAALLLWPRGPNREVTALGRVREPPAYLGLAVRAAPRAGDSLFAAAMDAYVTQRYDVAAAGLRAALAAGVDTVPAEFFLAAAELMRGKPREAVDGYAQVIAAGDAAAPYLPEAHMYRARASLQLSRARQALADLEAVLRFGGADSSSARALADSVRKAMRR
jgi:tetratricopeptide (TPR) repeat protein